MNSDTNQPHDVIVVTPPAPLAEVVASSVDADEKQRAYARGYAAGKKTVDQSHINALKAKIYHLQAEVGRIRCKNIERPGEYEGTVNYLITTSETFLKCADVMLRFQDSSSHKNINLSAKSNQIQGGIAA